MLAQEGVELCLACAVAHGESLQRGRLVVIVVINPGGRVRGHDGHYVIHERFECRFFLGGIARPEGPKTRASVNAKEVLEATVRVEGVTLHVKEQVSGMRCGQPGKSPARARLDQ